MFTQQKEQQPNGPRFQGVNALRLSETYTFGCKGTAYLKQHFDYLLNQTGKWNVRNIEKHPHPYLAFLRKHSHAIMMVGLCNNQNIVDVGGHAIRGLVTRDSNGESWSTRMHSMLPVVDFNDRLRHQEWEEKYITNGWNWPMPNSCNCRATSKGLCECQDSNKIRLVEKAFAFTSVDSAYYPGVMEGIEAELLRYPAKRAFFSFHDYHAAIRSGKMSGTTFDDEGKFEVTIGNDGNYKVQVQVNGNPFSYKHDIINTKSNNDMTTDTWMRHYTIIDKTVVYNVIKRMDTGAGYDYVTVRAQVVDGKHEYASEMPYFAAPVLKKDNRNIAPLLDKIDDNIDGNYLVWYKEVTEGYHQVSKVMKGMLADAWSLKNKLSAKMDMVVKITGVDTMRIHLATDKEVDGKKITEHKTLRIREKYVRLALKELAGKSDDSDVHRVTRVLLRYAVDNLDDDQQVSSLGELVSGSVIYAAHLNLEVMMPVLQHLDCHKKRFQIRQLIKGGSLLRENIQRQLWYQWLVRFMIAFVLMFGAAKVIEWFPRLFGVQAQGSSVTLSTRDYDVVYAMIAAGVISTFDLLWSKRRVAFQWLKGTCVTISDRLDLTKNKGTFDAQWKFRDPDMDITGLTGVEAREKLGCNKHGRIEAGQIGPIVRGSELYTPTIKHNCNCNIMAASIRATSNKIRPDAEVLAKWNATSLTRVFDNLIEGISKEGGITLNLEKWLKKYPEEYRDRIRVAARKIDKMEKPYTYDSFPKKELQYTTVPHSMKDSEMNEVKERQISGPSADKKIAANDFVNQLEKISAKYVKGYCGGKNWMEISGCIQEAEMKINNPIWFCADGSGFDMTQVAVIQDYFNAQVARLTHMAEESIAKVVQECAKQMNPDDFRVFKEKMNSTQRFSEGFVSYDEFTSADDTLRAFLQSRVLKVNVLRGLVQYFAEGRASGDGWTTWGNTILMIAYWMFTMQEAGVPDNDWYLMVKGDDVICCVDAKWKTQVSDAIDRLWAKRNEDKIFGLGQIVKFVKWGPIEECDFLSCMFFRTEHGLRMTRIPDRVFQTMPWSLKVSPGMIGLDDARKELIHSKGMSLLAWAEGLPIFEKYARKLMSLGKEGLLSEWNKYADEGREWCAAQDYDAMASWMNHRFGITRDDIVEIENAIDNIEYLDEEIVIPQLDKFREVLE